VSGETGTAFTQRKRVLSELTTGQPGRDRETMSQVRIAVAGAGMIGRRHIEEVDASESAELASIVEPGPAGPELAEKYGVPLYASLADLFADDKPDGVILATPNQMHADGGLECVAAGVPVIVEKPIGDNVTSAARLVEAGEMAGVPVLTGHHRNYSPIMAKAREIIQSGVLGTLVGVSGTALFYKPDDYFDVGGGWRREPGGGPILLNLTHEVNNLLSLVGDIDTVMAVTSNSIREFPVEDTSAMIFQFANGALGTFLLSDAAASARSWEQTSRENISYPTSDDEDAYHIAGTRGSLSVPTMRVKTYEAERSWWEPFTTSTNHVERGDPLANQVTHFAEVIRGAAAPICSGRDGLRTLQVVHAVMESARIGRPVNVAT
jgi:predicted dehydrogenase